MLTSTSREQDFPSLRTMAYFNTAAEGIPPRAVIDALHQYGQDKLLGMDGRVLHAAQLEALRARGAQFYGLTPAEVSFCSCTSEAFNLLATALRLGDGDEVVVNDLDYPAAVTPWFHEGGRSTVRVWRSRGGRLHVEDLVPLLGPRTRLVPLSLVSFLNGFMLPLPPVVEAVRRHSPALVAVDVTQALGRVPLDLAGVDFIVSSTHKWILGSHGGCIVGIPAQRASELTSGAGGWFNLDDPFSGDRFERPARNLPGAASYSVGMPNYAAVYAVRAALDYIADIGVARIHAHAQPLVRHCLSELRQLPVELITADDPAHLAGIVALRHPSLDRIHPRLRDADIHVMLHAGRLRIAIHGYNTTHDLERLVRVLAQALRDQG
jgi:selenocysteine lyase/cysteine desulfurase